MYWGNLVTPSMLEMFYCCTDALLFSKVVFKQFVIFIQDSLRMPTICLFIQTRNKNQQR